MTVPSDPEQRRAGAAWLGAFFLLLSAINLFTGQAIYLKASGRHTVTRADDPFFFWSTTALYALVGGWLHYWA